MEILTWTLTKQGNVMKEIPPDDEPTIDSFDEWCKESSESYEEVYDFRYLKIHPNIVKVLSFLSMIPMFIILFVCAFADVIIFFWWFLSET